MVQEQENCTFQPNINRENCSVRSSLNVLQKKFTNEVGNGGSNYFQKRRESTSPCDLYER